jgi:hypothetical protein
VCDHKLNVQIHRKLRGHHLVPSACNRKWPGHPAQLTQRRKTSIRATLRLSFHGHSHKIGFWSISVFGLDPSQRKRTSSHQIEIVRMSISLQLDDEQSERLEERARELGVDARELAKAAVNDLLTRPAEDFNRAASFVLEKNKELYRRLG